MTPKYKIGTTLRVTTVTITDKEKFGWANGDVGVVVGQQENHYPILCGYRRQANRWFLLSQVEKVERPEK